LGFELVKNDKKTTTTRTIIKPFPHGYFENLIFYEVY